MSALYYAAGTLTGMMIAYVPADGRYGMLTLPIGALLIGAVCAQLDGAP